MFSVSFILSLIWARFERISSLFTNDWFPFFLILSSQNWRRSKFIALCHFYWLKQLISLIFFLITWICMFTVTVASIDLSILCRAENSSIIGKIKSLWIIKSKIQLMKWKKFFLSKSIWNARTYQKNIHFYHAISRNFRRIIGINDF